MRRTWIAVYAASLLIGIALWGLAPRRWGLEFPQAILLGSALYFGALNRYTLSRTAERGGPPGSPATGRNRWIGRGGLVAGLGARAAFFLAVAGLQAYACFEWIPAADVRGGFVLSTTWLMALSLLDPQGSVKEPVGSS